MVSLIGGLLIIFNIDIIYCQGKDNIFADNFDFFYVEPRVNVNGYFEKNQHGHGKEFKEYVIPKNALKFY